MAPSRKKRKTENIVITPKTIRSIQFSPGSSSTHSEILYRE